jgi:hypothetical protein
MKDQVAHLPDSGGHWRSFAHREGPRRLHSLFPHRGSLLTGGSGWTACGVGSGSRSILVKGARSLGL